MDAFATIIKGPSPPPEKKRPSRAKAATNEKTTKKKANAVFAANVDDDDRELRAMSDDENVVLNLKVYETNGMNAGVEGMSAMDNIFESVYNNESFNHPDNQSHSIAYIDNVFNDNIVTDTQSFNTIHATQKVKGPCLKVIELLKDFEQKNKHNEWPTNTSIACYWCCHKFNNTPFGIPVRYANDRFHVYGCFCSLECAAAYNRESKDPSDDVWERASLINMLARKLEYKNQVKPAPPRLSLKMFGGHMDIDEFREYCSTNRIINVNFPPMMTLTQQIEEINEADINNDFRYIPIDSDRVNKFKEKIKLKRQKPITNFKNTLDHTMNLKYGDEDE